MFYQRCIIVLVQLLEDDVDINVPINIDIAIPFSSQPIKNHFRTFVVRKDKRYLISAMHR